MRDDLLAYLLNDLDDEQRQRIEERLEVDPIWQHELQRLRSYVEASHQQDTTGNEPHSDDTLPEDTLPEDLVRRTCSFVKQASSQGALSPAVLPAKLSESQDAAGSPPKKRWTLIDLAVVASILGIMGTLLVPAIRDSREAARRSQCEENLHTLGTALNRYAQQHNGDLPAIGPNENAGMYTVMLRESGLLTPEELKQSMLCPSSELAEQAYNGSVKLHVPTRRELEQATLAKLQLLLKRMGGSFAFRIGYYDEHGNYHQVKFTGSSDEPIMADKPSYRIVGFQSDHHGGCGQNVLFQDGRVRYVQICIQTGQDEHWFLNRENKHAAGTSESDIVMVRSEVSPTGTITLINDKQQGRVLPVR